ncbi:MAG: polysaccharide deacetylase family protein [Akkermansiaceae bacterium]|jgi:peptidoglycan/xylan/chitin deacetylase (PgdA/CDA1 family)|nr:polysaccharide deacetylase family protein [Akkermansiaceae bacterium]MCU0776043.1 polysaccharide deacetylase family protein [Akkermansiaceae bacterium]
MSNPLQPLGCPTPASALHDESSETGAISRLSRRGFMLMAASLSSCAAAKPLARNGPVKTPSNANYRTPSLQGPIPRNPDMSLSSDFSRGSGISFSRVLVSGNYVAMTFDDGPHPQNTPRLLDILRARNVKATFYVIGRSVDLYPQVVRRTVAEGHEIGNHSHTHRLLSKLGDTELRTEMARCRDAVGSAAGVRMRTMRPPYGGLLQRQRELVYSEFGYPTILWAVDPLDWKRPGPSVVTSRILSGTTAGSIILAHDLHAPTVDAMPATIDGLLRRGFKFVTVSQLLAMKTEPATAQASVNAVPGY